MNMHIWCHCLECGYKEPIIGGSHMALCPNCRSHHLVESYFVNLSNDTRKMYEEFYEEMDRRNKKVPKKHMNHYDFHYSKHSEETE